MVTEPTLDEGAKVEVRQRFDQRWARGFEVIAFESGRYRIKRLSDGSVLPDTFEPDEIRPERKKSGMWWY